jgi:hypothetical protein
VMLLYVLGRTRTTLTQKTSIPLAACAEGRGKS